MEIDLTEKPERIVAFDPARKKRIEVNLDEPFFTLKTPRYDECDHKRRGVELDTSTRTVYCRCGVALDVFDALLIYAHAERRLQAHAAAIKEHERKEQEKKDKRQFVRRQEGFEAIFDRRARIIGYRVRLECGHVYRHPRARRVPATVTCQPCYDAWKLQQQGVATLNPKGAR